MDFLKRHYEKILLSVVLLGLAVAAAIIPMRIRNNAVVPPKPPNPGEWTNVDVSTNLAILQAAQNAPRLSLSLPNHRLLNPVTWKRQPDGRLYPIREEPGPANLVVTKINPLYLRLEFKGLLGTGQPPRYQVVITQEADPKRGGRNPSTKLLALNDRIEDVLTAREIQGPADNPTALVVYLAGGNERVVLEKDKEFRRLAGYAADLKYQVDGRAFADVREGDSLDLSQKKYKVMAITENEVTVTDDKGKPTTRRLEER